MKYKIQFNIIIWFFSKILKSCYIFLLDTPFLNLWRIIVKTKKKENKSWLRWFTKNQKKVTIKDCNNSNLVFQPTVRRKEKSVE